MHHTDSLIGGFHGETLPTVLVNHAEEVMDIILVCMIFLKTRHKLCLLHWLRSLRVWLQGAKLIIKSLFSQQYSTQTLCSSNCPKFGTRFNHKYDPTGYGSYISKNSRISVVPKSQTVRRSNDVSPFRRLPLAPERAHHHSSRELKFAQNLDVEIH
jgi:hypothetical protein